MSDEPSAIRRADAMSHKPGHVGALAFKRSGDPNMGSYGDATILKTFDDVRICHFRDGSIRYT